VARGERGASRAAGRASQLRRVRRGRRLSLSRPHLPTTSPPPSPAPSRYQSQ
jgi:hypothetical protein